MSIHPYAVTDVYYRGKFKTVISYLCDLRSVEDRPIPDPCALCPRKNFCLIPAERRRQR